MVWTVWEKDREQKQQINKLISEIGILQSQSLVIYVFFSCKFLEWAILEGCKEKRAVADAHVFAKFLPIFIKIK